MNCLLITGASAGIGEVTAQRFIDAGYRVINLSRRPCPVAGVRHFPCDLADPDFLDDIAEPLDDLLTGAAQVVLVHNAARMDNDSARDTDSANLRAALEINLVAPNTLNRFAMRYLKPGSSIIYIGSTLSEKAVPGTYSYVVSKHALIGMMRATCQDLAGSFIHTVCICPGFTDTEMLREHVPEDVMPAICAMSAYDRLIEPEEIAETVFWCANNPVINGAVLHANLGQVER